MKRIFVLLIIIFGTFVVAPGRAEETRTLSATITKEVQIPSGLLGTWRVLSKIEETSNPENFKNNMVDIWNISKSGNVIKLCNPIVGVEATVEMDMVKGQIVKFKKVGNYDNYKVIDVVEITLSENSFVGQNKITLQDIDLASGKVKKEKHARYSLRGDKIYGASIVE